MDENLYSYFRGVVKSSIDELKSNSRTYIYKDDVLKALKEECANKNIEYDVVNVYDKDYNMDYYVVKLKNGG